VVVVSAAVEGSLFGRDFSGGFDFSDGFGFSGVLVSGW
jgi:hypothetical protein